MADVVIGLGSYTETDVASAATCDIGAATTQKVRITGTTTITSFGISNNRIRFVRFASALTLTHNAISLILPTAANISVAAGDTCIVMSGPSGNWLVTSYQRKDGSALAGLPAVNPSSTGTFLHTSAGPETTTFGPNWVFARTGGSAVVTVRGEGTTTFVVERYSTDATGPVNRLSKYRGTIASPTVIAQNDEVGEIGFRGYDGTTVRIAAQQVVTVIAATPAAGDMQARWIMSMCAAGSGSVTEALRFDHATGLSMGGANPVIAANRHHQLRSYTVAGLPSAATAGQLIYVSNETGGAVVAFSDGTNWRRVTDRAVVA